MIRHLPDWVVNEMSKLFMERFLFIVISVAKHSFFIIFCSISFLYKSCPLLLIINGYYLSLYHRVSDNMYFYVFNSLFFNELNT